MYATEILLKCLEYMKDESNLKRSIGVPFGLQVQQIYANLIEDMVLPFYANQKTIDIINKSSEFKESFFEEMDSKRAIRQSFLGELKVDNREIFRINARLNYKIIKLFNLSSSVYLTFQITEKIRACLFQYEISQFKKLNYSHVGLLIKSEIITLNMHYRIFYMNQVLTNRSHFFKNQTEGYYCEMEIIEDHLENAKTDETKSAWIWIKKNLIELSEFYKLIKFHLKDDEEKNDPNFVNKGEEAQLNQKKNKKSLETHNPEFTIKKDEISIIGDYTLNYLLPA